MSAENIIACVQLVHSAPRTVAEVADLLGVKRDTVRTYIELLADEGLVQVVDTRQGPSGPAAKVYAWVRQEMAEP